MDIILCGCNGKMGQAIVNESQKFCNMNIVSGVDIKPDSSKSFPIFSSINDVNIKADIIIDFSNPLALNSILEYSQNQKLPVVICTTGFSKEQVEKINEASKNIPVFYSGNMSLGINLLIELCQKATNVLGDSFDIEIIEKHHNQKIDAPSGTALMIANGISEHLDEKYEYKYNRTTSRAKRKKNEIGIHSIRGGTITGDHEVIFAGKDEIITISHHAASRNIFANGAINAAKYILNKTPGLYKMKNLINND
ncbi:MAG: 4-hydroxy-tetrahydrodipicolinate reductase [Clostridia bacterium]|nr:4-hydroxy-tetrahydrodipicolinate reductase [Clostridia bacterium]